MKNRRVVKRVLIIAGAVLAVAGTALFVINFIHIPEIKISDIYTAGAFMCAGIIPVSVGLLMHSKDIRDTKHGVSSLLKALGLFWLIGGGVNIIAIIVISLLFGEWAWGA